MAGAAVFADFAAPRAGFSAFSAVAAAAAASAGGAAVFFANLPKRPLPRSGAAAISSLHSSSVRVFGSRSLGIFAFFTTLGEAGALPPAVAVWSPSAVFAVLSIYLFLGVKT